MPTAVLLTIFRHFVLNNTIVTSQAHPQIWGSSRTAKGVY